MSKKDNDNKLKFSNSGMGYDVIPETIIKNCSGLLSGSIKPGHPFYRDMTSKDERYKKLKKKMALLAN